MTEASDYLGVLTIALALVWLVVAWRRRTELRTVTAGLVAAAVVGLLFAAPSPLSVFGHDVWMPSRLLWEVVPAFRVPSRWTPLVLAALVPLAALGLQWVSSRFTRPGRRAGLIPVAIVCAAAVFSFLELAISPAKHRFRTVPVPAEYAAVERTPKGVLAEYPLGSSDVYRFWQREHGRPLVNGLSQAEPAEDARLVLLDPAATGTAQALRLLGVTSIVIHQHAVVDVEVAARTPSAGDGYDLVGRFPDGTSVWKVDAHPAAALVTLPGGFAPPRAAPNGLVVYPLVSSSGVGVIQLRARQAEVVRLVFEATPPGGAKRQLRIADSQRERAFTLAGPMHVTVDVQIPRGLSQLLVKTDPAATSEADAILLTAPRAGTTSGKPVLQADLISPDPGF